MRVILNLVYYIQLYLYYILYNIIINYTRIIIEYVDISRLNNIRIIFII